MKKLNSNSELYHQFRQHYYRNGPELEVPCDESKCKKQLLCSLLTSEAQLVEQPTQCNFQQQNEVNWWLSFWKS